MSIRKYCYLFALFGLLALGGRAGAESFPSKPIRLVVPFSPGGATDVIGRAIAQELGKSLKQNVIVENREGAGGTVGAASVANARADGYTLLLSSLSTFGLGSPQLPYDPIDDLQPVGLVAYVSNVLVAPPSFPANTVQELISMAEGEPNSIRYGTGGPGTSVDLAALLFNMQAGVEMERIAYRGSSPALIDLVAERIDVMFDNMPSAMPLVEQGQLKAIAVTAGTRSTAFPDLPTIKESGLPDYELTAWFGISAPAGTPAPVVTMLGDAINAAGASADFRKLLANQSAELNTSGPEEFGKFYASEYDKYRQLMGEPPAEQ